MNKYYQVFCVYDCFDEYASDEFLVGAESEEDLINHLPDILKSYGVSSPKTIAKKIVKEKEWRIKLLEHLFTDQPYTTLHSSGYVE